MAFIGNRYVTPVQFCSYLRFRPQSCGVMQLNKYVATNNQLSLSPADFQGLFSILFT